METSHPRKVIRNGLPRPVEAIVRAVIPRRRHDEVLGDFHQHFVSTPRSLQRAADAAAFIVADEVHRTFKMKSVADYRPLPGSHQASIGVRYTSGELLFVLLLGLPASMVVSNWLFTRAAVTDVHWVRSWTNFIGLLGA